MKKQFFQDFAQQMKSSFSTRSFRVGSYSLTATAIVLAILVVVNLLVGTLPTTMTTVDISANALFSVSEQTEKIVSSVPEAVTLYWVVQPGVEDVAIGRLLERYDALSDLVNLESVDPDVYPNFVRNYHDGEVYNNSVVVTCGQRFKYVDYFDMYLTDYSDYATTGEIAYQFDGENALTSAVQYVTSDDLPVLYNLTGHGETSLAETYAKALSDDNFQVKELSLLTLEAVPEDADLILINAPQTDLSQEETQKLQAYVAQGGKLVVTTLPPQSDPLENFMGLLGAYGVSAEEGILVEGSQDHSLWGTPYYLLPEIRSHTITQPLLTEGYYVLLPLAQGIRISSTLPENVTVTELLTTSAAAYSKLAGYEITTYDKEEGDLEGPFSLAVLVEDATKEGKILWVSSGALMDEDTNSRISGGNLDFFMNSINWLCQREDAISIRAKDLGYTYLTMDEGTASVLSVVIVAVLPVVYLSVGIIIWFRRKRK